MERDKLIILKVDFEDPAFPVSAFIAGIVC